MPKGGGKGAGAKAAKAAHEEEVRGKKVAVAEAAEAAKWTDGARGKSTKDEKAEKAAKAAASKAERDRLLAAEESQVKSKPVVAKPDKKTSSAPKLAIPTATSISTSTSAVAAASASAASAATSVPTYSASNIDDAIAALDIVTEKTDKASVGAKAAQHVDTHPERRFKAAFEAYKESELPQLRKDFPGLRLQQYQDMLYKQFQKHPDNPFNQTTASYDATKADKIAALAAKREATESRLRTN